MLPLTRREILFITTFALYVIALIYAIFAGNTVLRTALVAVGVPFAIVTLVAVNLTLIKGAGTLSRRVLYATVLAITIPFWLLTLGEDFRLELPDWAKVVIAVYLLTGAATLLWSLWQLRREQRQGNEQKQLDQTKLHPLYGEQAKTEQVKEP
jgi:hypothetical protein